jgi:hypothetical protein
VLNCAGAYVDWVSAAVSRSGNRERVETREKTRLSLPLSSRDAIVVVHVVPAEPLGDVGIKCVNPAIPVPVLVPVVLAAPAGSYFLARQNAVLVPVLIPERGVVAPPFRASDDTVSICVQSLKTHLSVGRARNGADRAGKNYPQ